MKIDYPHIFEIQQKIQVSPTNQAYQSELNNHLAECSECRENMIVIDMLKNAFERQWALSNKNMEFNSQMVNVVKKRLYNKRIFKRFMQPLPGLAWITIGILIVVVLSWAIDSLRAGPSVIPTTLRQPFTPQPSVTAPYNVFKECRNIIYTVNEGDTLLAISDYFNEPIDALWKDNHLGDGSVLKPGMRLNIQFCGWTPTIYTQSQLNGITPIKSCPLVRYQIQEGDSLESITKALNVPIETILTTNQIKNGSILSPGDELVITLCNNP